MSSDYPQQANVGMGNSPKEKANPLSSKHAYQINLQVGMGGGEIYTRFFTQALLALGWKTTLYVRRNSWLAENLIAPGVELIPVNERDEIPRLLPDDGAPVFAQTPFSGIAAENIRRSHPFICFAHMPLYGRDPSPYHACDWIIAVSQYVIDSIRAAGISHVYPEPLYGVASLDRGNDDEGPIVAGPVYDWDKRKVRDRLLGLVYPLYFRLKPRRVFKKRPGLTLGIVSRLTPIKQFPLLFTLLAPILKKHPTVNLEIFGSGGYASVRDLRRALRPVVGQIRFWGHQHDVRSVYHQLDYLMTGLPEKEALGLNIIEAQACGTPILAVDAPPFTETVVGGETGYFFTDPRQDNGHDFARLLEKLLSDDGKRLDDPRRATAHLERFSFEQFSRRVERAINATSRLPEVMPCG